MKIKRYFYYILDVTDIHNPFIYNKSFHTKERAREVIDAYLDPDKSLTIHRGDWVRSMRLKVTKAPFPNFKPHTIRHPENKKKETLYKKRDRLKGKGIKTHLFKREWEYREPGYDKRKVILKDRDLIRNIILK